MENDCGKKESHINNSISFTTDGPSDHTAIDCLDQLCVANDENSHLLSKGTCVRNGFTNTLSLIEYLKYEYI